MTSMKQRCGKARLRGGGDIVGERQKLGFSELGHATGLVRMASVKDFDFAENQSNFEKHTA